MRRRADEKTAAGARKNASRCAAAASAPPGDAALWEPRQCASAGNGPGERQPFVFAAAPGLIDLALRRRPRGDGLFREERVMESRFWGLVARVSGALRRKRERLGGWILRRVRTGVVELREGWCSDCERFCEKARRVLFLRCW